MTTKREKKKVVCMETNLVGKNQVKSDEHQFFIANAKHANNENSGKVTKSIN